MSYVKFTKMAGIPEYKFQETETTSKKIEQNLKIQKNEIKI